MKNLVNQQPVMDHGQNIDELLQDLGRMLEVTPSPEFGAKVMARVERPTRESLLWSWRWGFAAGALLTVVVLTVVTRVNSTSSFTQLPEAPVTRTVASPAIEPISPASAMTGPVRESQMPREPVRIAVPAVQHPRNPQVLIAPDQSAAVRTLLDRFARGHVPSTVLNKDTAEPVLQELAIDELAPIPLIVISPLDAPPNAGGAGSNK